MMFVFFSSRRRHTRSTRDWSSDVCSSDLWAVRDPDGWCTVGGLAGALPRVRARGALRRERRGGDVRPEAGVRAVRAVTPGAAVVLGPPPLGLAPTHATVSRRPVREHRIHRPHDLDALVQGHQWALEKAFPQ